MRYAQLFISCFLFVFFVYIIGTLQIKKYQALLKRTPLEWNLDELFRIQSSKQLTGNAEHMIVLNRVVELLTAELANASSAEEATMIFTECAVYVLDKHGVNIEHIDPFRSIYLKKFNGLIRKETSQYEQEQAEKLRIQNEHNTLYLALAKEAESREQVLDILTHVREGSSAMRIAMEKWERILLIDLISAANHDELDRTEINIPTNSHLNRLIPHARERVAMNAVNKTGDDLGKLLSLLSTTPEGGKAEEALFRRLQSLCPPPAK